MTNVERICCIGISVGFMSSYESSSVLKVVNRVQSAIHSVLTTRIILNIREAASRRRDDFSSDLHLSETNSHASRPRMDFAENQALTRSGGDQESGSFRYRERYDGGSSMGRTEIMSISTHTVVSHVTLPVTRDARGKKVVGRAELDDDDDMDSIRTSPEDWV
jgi:hypothetical protein